MEILERKSISDKLRKYDYLAKEDDYIEVTEWGNGEGWDITLNEQVISLTWGQLDAIDYLIKHLQYNK
jgi:hypothetical protein